MQQVFYRSDNLPTGRLTPSNSAFADHCVHLQNYIYLHGTEKQKKYCENEIIFFQTNTQSAGWVHHSVSFSALTLAGWMTGRTSSPRNTAISFKSSLLEQAEKEN